MKVSVHQEYVNIINICIPNYRRAKYMKQKLMELKGETDSSTVIGGDFNTPLSIIDRTTREKIRKEIEDLPQ